jgi:hypothetical protein
MVFTQGTLLQQHFTFTIKNKNAKSTMQYRLAVSFHLFHYAYRFILCVDQYYIGYFTHSTKLLNNHGVTISACTKSYPQNPATRKMATIPGLLNKRIQYNKGK